MPNDSTHSQHKLSRMLQFAVNPEPRVWLGKGRPPIRADIRFWKFVEKTEYCWVWRGSGDTYGQFKFADKHGFEMVGAHIFSYILSKKKKPPLGKFVCHKCDNPMCVRPSHLWIGTRLENSQDMVKKGRQLRMFGPDNPLWGRVTRGFSGRKHSSESVARMKLVHTGVKHTEQTKRKIAIKSSQRKASEETKKKISMAKKGKKLTMEHRRKISIGLRTRICL